MRMVIVATIVVLVVFAICGVWGTQDEEIAIYGGYEDVPAVGWWPADASGVIGVGGVMFFQIPDDGGGLPLVTRAEIVDTRITAILSDGIAGPVRVGEIRGQPTLYVGPYRLITVYDIDAVNAGASSAQALAKNWAQSLALGLPQVLPSPYASPASD